jgi:hypothetical protein
MKRPISRTLASWTVALVAAATLSSAAHAQGFTFFKKGDWSFTPAVGAIVSANAAAGTGAFGLFFDLDHHLTSHLSIGPELILGFGSNTIIFDVGPQVKYKFRVGGGAHVPYLLGGFFFRVRRTSVDQGGFGSASSTNFGLGFLKFGGGYKYFFSNRFGVGLDLGFMPSAFFGDNTSFIFGINIQAGVEIRF